MQVNSPAREVQKHAHLPQRKEATRKGSLKCLLYQDFVAEPTGLEPATSDVTGRRSNQLNYDSAKLISMVGDRFLKSPLSGRHGGIRTPNLHLVRVAVYH